ncbi:MAG: hypothetical protein K0B87_02335 [Candidatus Syntrophosphaera sp.]|nr:hypothetical protein [Candidatus Syntrophosphaera sp.]
MIKLPHSAPLLLLLAIGLAHGLTLSDAGDYIRFSKINASDIRIEINIGSLSFDATGRVELPARFAPYLMYDNALPVLKLQVALPTEGNYYCQIDQHLHDTAIAWENSSGTNGQTL